MKNILKLLVLLVLVGGTLVSCETYGDPEVELSNVAPLDGRWVAYAFDYDEYQTNPRTAVRRELMEIYSTGTSDNTPGKLWLHMGFMLRNNAISIETVSVLVDCNPKEGTFILSNGKTGVAPTRFGTVYYRVTDPALDSDGNYSWLHVFSGYLVTRATIATANQGITIGDGKVTVNGYNTPTGYKSDHIVFTLDIPSELDENGNPGHAKSKYVIEGHRLTGWADDYNSKYDTSTAHHKWNVAAYIEEYIWRRDGVWPIPSNYAPRNTFQNGDYATL